MHLPLAGRINAPCYKCEKRTVGCHATCSDYTNYKVEMKDDHIMRENDIRSFVGYMASLKRKKERSQYRKALKYSKRF